MPYTPKESMATLRHLYHEYGDRLWGEFGFRDSFRLGDGGPWVATDYVAIDQGPMLLAIEIAKAAESKRAQSVDAPVSGGDVGAEQ